MPTSPPPRPRDGTTSPATASQHPLGACSPSQPTESYEDVLAQTVTRLREPLVEAAMADRDEASGLHDRALFASTEPLDETRSHHNTTLDRAPLAAADEPTPDDEAPPTAQSHGSRLPRIRSRRQALSLVPPPMEQADPLRIVTGEKRSKVLDGYAKRRGKERVVTNAYVLLSLTHEENPTLNYSFAVGLALRTSENNASQHWSRARKHMGITTSMRKDEADYRPYAEVLRLEFSEAALVSAVDYRRALASVGNPEILDQLFLFSELDKQVKALKQAQREAWQKFGEELESSGLDPSAVPELARHAERIGLGQTVLRTNPGGRSWADLWKETCARGSPGAMEGWAQLLDRDGVPDAARKAFKGYRHAVDELQDAKVKANAAWEHLQKLMPAAPQLRDSMNRFAYFCTNPREV